MSWLVLGIAIVTEVCGTLSLRMAAKGSRWWYVGVAAGYGIGFTLCIRTVETGGDHLVREDKQKGRDQHRQGHNQQQLIRQRLVKHGIGHCKGDQDESKFTRLRQIQPSAHRHASGGTHQPR